MSKMILSKPPYERTCYPKIEPYNTGMLRVSDTHEIQARTRDSDCEL
jgi:hypothetical protein